MTPLGEVAEPPAAFRRAVATLHAFPARPEVVVEDMPAPQRLAPYAAALSASVLRPQANGVIVGQPWALSASVLRPSTQRDGDDLAVGRLIVLYDPQEQRGWHGPFRIVAYVRADLEMEMASDPLLGSVGWSWLTEALEVHDAGYAAASGTVTRAVSESFGDKRGEEPTVEFELRASWSPLDDDMSPHVAAWCDVLCAAAGLPPVPPGVAALPPRRGEGGR